MDHVYKGLKGFRENVNTQKHTSRKLEIVMPANIDIITTSLHDTLFVKVFRVSVTAADSVDGFTPRNITSQLQNTSPFFSVILAPISLQWTRFFKWGPDTQILDAGWVPLTYNKMFVLLKPPAWCFTKE